MIADYHIHTRLCRHAEGEPREYVERAIGLGMSEMGFADHLPFLGGWQPGHGIPGDDWSMELDGLDGYVSLVQALAREYAADLRILVGIEADYIEETLDDTARVLGEYPFDYVIGSVHIVGERFAFDHPASRDRVQGYGIDRMHLESLENVERAAATGLFHVIGHLDQAKKFGHRPDDAEAVTAAAATTSRNARPRAWVTPRASPARPWSRGSTSSAPSAATAPSTRPSTGSPAPRCRWPSCPRARSTCWPWSSASRWTPPTP